MKQNDVEEAYVRAASEHGAATDRGDHERANIAHGALIRAAAAFRKQSDRGQSLLRALLEHGDPHVRCWAATHLLPLDEAAALRALEALGVEQSLIGLNATMVLREWKAGRLKGQ